jgi:hypothetical protein
VVVVSATAGGNFLFMNDACPTDQLIYMRANSDDVYFWVGEVVT